MQFTVQNSAGKPGIHSDVNSTCATLLNAVADKGNSQWLPPAA